jgi:hypothetical protein
VLASIEQKAATTIASEKDREADNIVRPAVFGGWNLIPWAAAACFAFGAAWLGLRYVSTRSEADALRNWQELAKIQLQSKDQQLEAARILSRARIDEAQQQLAAANSQLGDARTQLTDRERLLADVRTQLADRERQVADSRTQLNDRERQVALLTQRIESLAADMKAQGDLSNLKIAALASMLKDSPEAMAIAVWNPAKQEGVFAFEKLPPVSANQKLELWVVEAREGAKPISAGVMSVNADGTARVFFKLTAPVTALAAFAVSREKDDGLRAHAIPAEVIMLGHSR